MIYKSLASAAATAIVGTALIATPAQARFGGFGGGFGAMHAGGFGGVRVGGLGGFHNGFVGHPAFAGRAAFVNRGFFPHNRFAFFPRHRFIAPFFGVGALYAAGYASCWTWVPTVYGPQRVWACDSDYGYGYY